MKNQLTTLLPMLRRFAYSLTGSITDADDLVQTTIEKIESVVIFGLMNIERVKFVQWPRKILNYTKSRPATTMKI
jgi:hypothetical protein